ncbi:MAG TPA: hypothetical protein VN019_07810 [Oxalicibacterium sp.]|nr:hypothetical protein [Oxalicibacterium sp.]
MSIDIFRCSFRYIPLRVFSLVSSRISSRFFSLVFAQQRLKAGDCPPQSFQSHFRLLFPGMAA